MMNEGMDKLGQEIDRLDSVAQALSMPLPDSLHVQALRETLPALVAAPKAAFAPIAGSNPWE